MSINTPINTTVIERKKYPQLDFLLWDNVAPMVSGELAFATYERKWRFVFPEELEDTERALIAELTTRYGCGAMLIASD